MLVLPPSRMLSTNRSASSRTAGAVALELGLEALDAVVVDHDVEQVVVAEVIQDRLEGLAGLLDLLAGHRTRAVDHEDDGLGQRLGVGRLDLGAGEDQEIAILRLAGPDSSGPTPKACPRRACRPAGNHARARVAMLEARP